MNSSRTPDAVQRMLDARKITDADVLTLRETFYADGEIGDAEADHLFALNATLREADASWDVLFVEALTDYCVHQVEPRGYVSEDKAQWLIKRVSHDGAIEAARELELLVCILQKSTSSPPSLAAFVLKAVRDCVLAGSGPLRGRTPDFRPKVCAQDVDVMRRAIFAFGAGGNIFVTREEAEMLCDINDATANAANDPSWPDLFAKAIGNHLMMAATFKPATRDAAAARDKWLDDQSSSVGGFFGKMASSLKDAFKRAPEDAWAARERQRDADIATAAPVDGAEAAWLSQRFERDGRLSPAEEALVRFVKADGAPVHASLQPLLARVA
jgi:hypothetical protein